MKKRYNIFTGVFAKEDTTKKTNEIARGKTVIKYFNNDEEAETWVKRHESILSSLNQLSGNIEIEIKERIVTINGFLTADDIRILSGLVDLL